MAHRAKHHRPSWTAAAQLDWIGLTAIVDALSVQACLYGIQDTYWQINSSQRERCGNRRIQASTGATIAQPMHEPKSLPIEGGLSPFRRRC